MGSNPGVGLRAVGRVQLKLGHDSYDKRLTGDRKRWKLEDRLAQALAEIEDLAAAAEERRLEVSGRLRNDSASGKMR